MSVRVRVDMSDFDRGAAAFEAKMQNVPFQIAQNYAPQMETHAKRTAPWTDRTSNARQGLQGQAAKMERDAAIIVLSTGMDYGKWLELRWQGRFAVIMPTMEFFYAKMRRELRLR